MDYELYPPPKDILPLDTGSEQTRLPGAWSEDAFTPVGCQSRSIHKQKCKLMHKWTLIRIYLFSCNLGRPRAVENMYYSIWIEGTKMILVLELWKGHQTQISWGIPKLPFLQGFMQSQCNNKKQMALTHRAAYLEQRDKTIIQCCCL